MRKPRNPCLEDRFFSRSTYAELSPRNMRLCSYNCCPTASEGLCMVKYFSVRSARARACSQCSSFVPWLEISIKVSTFGSIPAISVVQTSNCCEVVVEEVHLHKRSRRHSFAAYIVEQLSPGMLDMQDCHMLQDVLYTLSPSPRPAFESLDVMQ